MPAASSRYEGKDYPVSVSTVGLLQDLAAFVTATKDPSSADRPVRLATVDSAYTSGWPKVTFDGESALSQKAYPHLDSYVPARGDRVVLVPVGTTYLIIGAVSSTGAGLPAGAIVEFGAAAVPPGWLACDGAAVSRTVYARLFAAVGTTWGAGNGSTTFNVPDFRGRVPVGVGTGSGLTARTLAASGGAETVQLTEAQMPSHTHTFGSGSAASAGAHTHSVTGTATAVSDHSHSVNAASSGAVGVVANGATGYAQVNPTTTGSAGGHSHSLSATAESDGEHTHTVTGTNADTGSDEAHANMQPWTAVTFMIKV